MAVHHHTPKERKRIKAKRKKKAGPSAAKARKMLKEGKAQGKPLTPKQRKFFGAVIGRARKRRP